MTKHTQKEYTRNILNGIKWGQLLRCDDSAEHITRYLYTAYKSFEQAGKLKSQQDLNAYNSMYNLLKNKTLTIGQLCKWAELNCPILYKPCRISQKDSNYIIATIAMYA